MLVVRTPIKQTEKRTCRKEIVLQTCKCGIKTYRTKTNSNEPQCAICELKKYLRGKKIE